jgi:hypothetical protein
MNKSIAILILLALLLPQHMQAQKRRNARKPKVVVPAEDPKFVFMLQSTAKVVIADSLVIDSVALLQHLHVNPEEGAVSTYADFFNTDPSKGYVYVNELGNKCIYSRPDNTGHLKLYQSDKIGNQWTKGEELKGIDLDGGLTDFNYPYLMPDGITLYFSAKGSNSLGGYDIYRTRLDIDEKQFLRPENIGLPFNSPSDDYMYFIDEQNQLGYFTSTRRQPKDTVCVYTFVPFSSRTIINPDQVSGEKLRSLARIDRISDTWGNGTQRKQALNRMKTVANTANSKNRNTDPSQSWTFSFVINDVKTYHKLADFRYDSSRNKMIELLTAQGQLRVLETTLNKMRNQYADATGTQRVQLRSNLMENEQQYESLQQQIKQLEKEIRNTENQ